MRCCIIENDVVVTVIEYDTVPTATPPGMESGTIAVASDIAQIGWTLSSGQLMPPAPAAVDIAVLKADLCNQIDAAAETVRLKYITGGAGQALTYAQKADEAKAFLAATSPVATDYPLLNAEVGITATDIAGVAQVVKTAYGQWQLIGGAIEAARLKTKMAIAAASSVSAVQAAASSVVWPSS